MTARSDEERSELCLACGLCCQGALHDLVPLDEDEIDRATKLRLPVIESALRVAFRLPCPRLDGARCTVYAERPRTCASYACDVLRAFGERAIEREEALDRIARVRDASARVSRLEGSARTDAIAELAWMRRTWFDP